TGYDGEVRLWNFRNPDADPLVVRGHDNAINALVAPTSGSISGSTSARSALPDMLVTAGYDGSLRVWHTKNPYAEPHQVLRAGGAVADVAVSPDGTQLASFTFDDSTIQLWDAQSGIEEKELARGDAPVAGIAYSQAPGVLWVGAKDGSITEWDTEEGVLLRRWHAGDDAINTVAEGPAGTPAGGLLASGGEDSVVRLWDIQSGSLVRELKGHTGVVNGVAFTEDGKSLVSGGEGTGTLRIWDVATGVEKQALQGPTEGLLDVAVQPHGPWLVGAGKDGAVWVWNADALAFEPAQLSRHGTEVNAVNFSADGQVLASAGSDGVVYLWSTVNPSAEPDALAGHGNSVNGISFAPDGTWLVSGSGDGTIRRWSLSIDELIAEACHTAGRNFTLAEWTQYFPTDVSSYHKTCPNLPGPN
ncbi:MAG: WD40 repeat domain-containing protein, partial [Caldilineaceae bacterium]